MPPETIFMEVFYFAAKNHIMCKIQTDGMSMSQHPDGTVDEEAIQSLLISVIHDSAQFMRSVLPAITILISH